MQWLGKDTDTTTTDRAAYHCGSSGPTPAGTQEHARAAQVEAFIEHLCADWRRLPGGHGPGEVRLQLRRELNALARAHVELDASEDAATALAVRDLRAAHVERLQHAAGAIGRRHRPPWLFPAALSFSLFGAASLAACSEHWWRWVGAVLGLPLDGVIRGTPAQGTLVGAAAAHD